MQNVLVLGGSGFIGAHVCEKLVRAGCKVTVPTRRWANAKNVLPLPLVTVLEANVHDPAALAALMPGHDAVVNLVAILHGNATEFEKAHVTLPRIAAQAALAAGVGRMVHVSALGADGIRADTLPSMYLQSKSRGELALHALAGPHLAVQVLRPSVVFGEGDRFLNLFARLQKVLPVMPLAGANARFQPVWVEDVASAIVAMQAQHAATHWQVTQACGPDIFTLAELVRLAAVASHANGGMHRPVIPLPNVLGYLQALVMEWLPGAPLMSRDNLRSMKFDNVAASGVPGLDAWGIQASALEPIASEYLAEGLNSAGLLGVRRRVQMLR